MPLVLKLVGQFQCSNTYEIRDSINEQINIKLLNEKFIFFGLSHDEINKIIFINNSEQIKNLDKNFIINADKDLFIFMFTSDIELRNKLFIIFMNKGNKVYRPGYSEVEEVEKVEEAEESTSSQHFVQPVSPDPEICKPITMKVSEPTPKLTNELIDLMNIKAVSLFNDPDFKYLISIYIRRPELFGTIAQYIQNGDVIEESLCHIKTIDELNDEEIKHYQILSDKINHLGIDITNEVIINKLIKFSGHLNLTLRSILCDMAKNYTI